MAEELEAFLATLRAWLSVDHNEDGTHNLRPSGFDFSPIGTVQMWPGDTAPTGWLICDGAAISRITYRALFQVCGTKYGGGDGSTTFNLPDMRQRFPMGKAASGTGNALGATFGAIDHVHTIAHTHSVPAIADHQHGPGTLETNSVADHNHSGSTGSSGAHTHSVSGTTTTMTSAGGFAVAAGTDDSCLKDPAHTHDFSETSSSDGDHSHSISDAGGHSHDVSSGLTAAAGSVAEGTSGASSAADSGTNNPPGLVFNFIILSGVGV